MGTERPRIRAPPSGNAGHTRANSGKVGAHPWGKPQKGNGWRESATSAAEEHWNDRETGLAWSDQNGTSRATCPGGLGSACRSPTPRPGSEGSRQRGRAGGGEGGRDRRWRRRGWSRKWLGRARQSDKVWNYMKLHDGPIRQSRETTSGQAEQVGERPAHGGKCSHSRGRGTRRGTHSRDTPACVLGHRPPVLRLDGAERGRQRPPYVGEVAVVAGPPDAAREDRRVEGQAGARTRCRRAVRAARRRSVAERKRARSSQRHDARASGWGCCERGRGMSAPYTRCRCRAERRRRRRPR